MQLWQRNMLKAWRLSEILFEELLRMEKNEEREEHTIAPAELNNYLAEFIHSLRRWRRL